MHGAGIKRVITIVRAGPVLLDISRLVSRVGRGPATGIDRVELAYLEWCLATDAPLYLIVRLASGYALLNRAGATALSNKLTGKIDWGGRDFRARMGLKTHVDRGRAEADIRRLAISQGRRSDLKTVLSRLDLTGFTYINVGHSNLSDEKLSAIKRAGLRICIMIHDLIPRLYPELQRPASVERFETKLTAIERYADVLIANSEQTRKDCRSELAFNGAIQTAHLGVWNQTSLGKTDSIWPYLIAIGTIEPRKNYDFLLDVWEHLESSRGTVPDLHIVGQRGWADPDLFARLDRLRTRPWLNEHNDLDDDALGVLLAGSNGLVYPTLAEGFGLPSVEAASLGVPVICGDLAIHRELLADYPVYAPLGDIYAWTEAVLAQIDRSTARIQPARPGPTWAEHFTIVSDFLTKHSQPR